MNRSMTVILVVAAAVLGTFFVGLGGYWYGDAMVRLDPGDPTNFDTPAEANDSQRQEAMHEDRAARVQLGFVALTVGAGLLGLAALLSVLAKPAPHIHRQVKK